MGFESLSSSEREAVGAEKDTLEKHADRVLARSEFRMADFQTTYGDTYKHDVVVISEMERANAKKDRRDKDKAEAYRFAKIFEAAVIDAINNVRSRWFGEGTEVRKTAKYDDLKNGVDHVLTFQDGDSKESHYALGLDVTYGDPAPKMERIRERMNDQQLARVKYFRSSDGGIGLENVAHVVIGADKKHFDEVAELWHRGNYAELEVHPARFMILEQIRLQAEAYREYAHAIGFVEAEEKYRELEERIVELQSHFPRRPKHEDFKNDGVYATISTIAKEKIRREARLKEAA